ncbi:hypothetical protein [Acinetobacter rudis]|uniref:hypothetical protein n=1 Tax=Acinetobacter rudis TaxID=632955 RepID=UPI003341F37C
MTHIVKISTDSPSSCQHCKNVSFHSADFVGSVNHMLEEHDYKIEHIGTESVDGGDGIFHYTIAVLSK